MSLTELLVVCALMGLVLAVVYMGIQFAYQAQTVAEKQAQFAREITGPLNMMDISFSQRVPLAGSTYNEYSATVRLPADYRPGQILEHTYTATADGRLSRMVHRVYGTARSLESSDTLSEVNVNVAKSKPLFRYYASGSPTTSVNAADYVIVDVYVEKDGEEYSDSRTIYFRNR